MNRILSSFLFLLLATIAEAQTTFQPSLWQNQPSGMVVSNATRIIRPQKESIFSVNDNFLKSLLFSLSSDPTQPTLISLPTPSGEMRNFKVWREEMMEPALAAKYPEIRTFAGYAEDKKSVTIKLDYSPSGFHGMVFSEQGIYFIDPYSNMNDGLYSCYAKSDLAKPIGLWMSCETGKETYTDGNEINLSKNGIPNAQLRVNGATKMTYRLALACTAEYAIAVAGNNPTKSAVLSKMVTTMNRVNGVYERELGVHMNLVANTDTLIFLVVAGEPYTNSSGSNMLGQNQTTVTARIGAANYDIGHVFSTGGGGIATLACVCRNSLKAQGVTGSPNPVGDPFDIDYVSHEMGHQFGAEHTFNASTGSCSGNGNQSTAYEPGSASTIMGYAGICGGGNDLQPHSDAYFHAISLYEISRYITIGNGNGCAVSAPSNNNPPVVPSFTAVYATPKLTPFALTAPTAIDSDHDTLTYCWEEWNLGDYGKNWAQTRLAGPIFRSFKSDTGRTRVFPTMSRVLLGVTNYLGEKLPDTTRMLKFKLTVRDIYNGTGTFNFADDSIVLNVTNSAGPFVVLWPTGATNWLGSTTDTVKWDVAGTDVAPVSCSNVDILLSIDGGITYPYTLAANTPNDGAEVITIPNLPSTSLARVMVRSVGNVFFNVNQSSFNITFNTGIKNVNWQNALNIFPIPASEAIHIVNNSSSTLEVRITNAIGQNMYHNRLNRTLDIPVNLWSKGVYYLLIINPSTHERTSKVVMVQ
ncbi:MAG: T9SS type A sorting domain-containing protein [Bacteroidetes bacterium]|nr:T9SS type A sorting domain-containing protein [Bacteroidota bacterium]